MMRFPLRSREIMQVVKLFNSSWKPCESEFGYITRIFRNWWLPSEGPKAWLSASPYLQFILVRVAFFTCVHCSCMDLYFCTKLFFVLEMSVCCAGRMCRYLQQNGSVSYLRPITVLLDWSGCICWSNPIVYAFC